MSEQASELRITATLSDGKKEVATVEKIFGVLSQPAQPEQDETENKSLDETVQEFLKEVETAASEKGYTVDKETLTEAAIKTILFLVKPTEAELKLVLPIAKPEVKEDAARETNT